MSGIAEVLLNLGYPVSGSDIKRSALTRRLRKLGARVAIGHRAGNIGGAEVVVVSSAIKNGNPEVEAARRKSVRIVQRAEMLAEVMRLAKYGIAVSGTHGKTTTTSLIAEILGAAGLDPTVIIGGRVKNLGSNARLGKGDFMVAEADESDGSFLKLYPSIAVVTNMDREHMDYYRSFQKYREAFVRFCQHLPFYGLAVLCGEHPETLKLVRQINTRSTLYGFSGGHDWNAQNIRDHGSWCQFDLCQKSRFLDCITLKLAGRHNVLNALASITVAREIGVSLDDIKKGLSGFQGVGRRMEVLCKNSHITVIDDYGHHPVEIQNTLQAVRNAYSGRLVVLFQPHRYTRTEDLFGEFVKSFKLADYLFVMDIYPAGEAPIRGVSGRRLAQAIGKNRAPCVEYAAHSPQIIPQILSQFKKGDVFLSLGAGDVTFLTRKMLKDIKRKFSEN